MEVKSTESNPNKRKNRKRKINFLQNARKYAKKGTFGRGSHLSEDTYQYFVRVLEIYKDGFPTEEEKLIFANNVFEQTNNEELNYSRNQIGCRVIETLLPFANQEVLDKYTEAFSSDLRPLCSDRFASHVLQELLNVCCMRSLDEKENNNCKDFTLKISKFLLNNIEDYINDPYANHIIRTVVQSLSGIPKDEKNAKEIVEEKKIPEEYTDIVKEYASRLMSWPHFKDFPYHELTSGLLQVLLKALHKIDLKLLKQIQNKLLEESYAVSNDETLKLPDVFMSKPATMLLEASLNLAVSKIFTQIYAKCFVGHLVVLAKKKECNFTVQKLLNNCSEKTEFEAIFDELSDHFEEILQCGHTGVILSIVKTCKRLTTKQGNFVTQMMKALHCLEPADRQDSFILTVARLVPFERLEAGQKEHYFINLHGSIILQVMLEFNKPIKIINSLLALDSTELEKLFCDSKGSHIMDSYMQSQYVGEKSRERLIRKMQGTYQNLVLSKFGSRSFEAIWKVANLKQRTQIMDEISYKDGAWTSSEFGKIIAGKVNIQLYKRNKDDWMQFIGKADKTKNLFADIIGEK